MFSRPRHTDLRTLSIPAYFRYSCVEEGPILKEVEMSPSAFNRICGIQFKRLTIGIADKITIVIKDVKLSSALEVYSDVQVQLIALLGRNKL